MPAGPITINPGDALPETFTAVPANGTPPFSYVVSVSPAESQTGLALSISGGSNEVVNLVSTGARPGFSGDVRLTVVATDDLGDQAQATDHYTISVSPIVAAWSAGALTIPSMEQNATSAETATLARSSGGATPFSYSFDWAGGSPPATGMTITVTGGDTVAVTTSGSTPPGTYNSVIRGIAIDNNGYELAVDLPVAVTVLGLRDFSWSPNPLTSDVTFGNELTTGASVLGGGTGGETPYEYVTNFFPSSPSSLISLNRPTPSSVSITADQALGVGEYSGVIRGEVRDAANNRFVSDLAWALSVALPTGNSVYAQYQALSADHYWELDEEQASFADNGLSASLPFGYPSGTGEPGQGQVWEAAPGPIRGEPRVFGQWYGEFNLSHLQRADGPALAGWTRAAFFCFYVSGNKASGQKSIFSYYLNANSNVAVDFEIEDDGTLICQIARGVPTNVLRAETAAGTITHGFSGSIGFTQNADGTGIRIFVNGVDATDNNSISGAATLDSWADDLHNTVGADTYSGFYLAAAPLGGNEGAQIISAPVLYVNKTIGAAEMLAMHQAGNLTGVTDTEFWDYALGLLNDSDLKNLVMPGMADLASNLRVISLGGADSTTGDESLIISAFNSIYVNLVTNLPYGSPFTSYKLQYNNTAVSPTVVSAGGISTWRHGASGFSTGTILCVVGKSGQDFITTDQIFFSSGVSSVSARLRIYFAGSAQKMRPTVDISIDNFTNYYRLQVSDTAPIAARPELGERCLIAVSQDGTGMTLYVNGVALSGTDVVETIVGTGSATWWFDDVYAVAAIPSGNHARLGGEPSSASVRAFRGEYFFQSHTEKVLTSEEISLFWDAYKGTMAGVQQTGTIAHQSATANRWTVSTPDVGSPPVGNNRALIVTRYGFNNSGHPRRMLYGSQVAQRVSAPLNIPTTSLNSQMDAHIFYEDAISLAGNNSVSIDGGAATGGGIAHFLTDVDQFKGVRSCRGRLITVATGGAGSQSLDWADWDVETDVSPNGGIKVGDICIIHIQSPSSHSAANDGITGADSDTPDVSGQTSYHVITATEEDQSFTYTYNHTGGFNVAAMIVVLRGPGT